MQGSRESRRCLIHGVRRVAVVLAGMGLVAGCVNSDVSGPSDSGPSGPSPSGPTISNLAVLTGANRELAFRMSATDSEGDVVGGRCLLSAFGITANPSITVTPAPDPAAPLTVTCTVTIPSGLTGQRFRGAIAIADARGNASNQLSFSTTLPEAPRSS